MSSTVAFAALRECRLNPYLCHSDGLFLFSVAVPLSAVRVVAAVHYPDVSPDDSVEPPDALAVFPDVLSCPGILAAKSYLLFHAVDLDVPAALIFVLCTH